MDWAKELEKQVTEDLDDNSKESLSLKMEMFGSRWDVFIEKMDVFSEKQAKVFILASTSQFILWILENIIRYLNCEREREFDFTLL